MRELLVPLLILYIIENSIPRIMSGSYIVPIMTVSWLIYLNHLIKKSGKESLNLIDTDQYVFPLILMFTFFQIFLTIFMGFFQGFAYNITKWPLYKIVTYFPFLILPIIGTEINRNFITKKEGRRNPVKILLITSIFYTIIQFPIAKYQSLNTPMKIIKFFIEDIAPTLSINMIATYFSILDGFTSSIVYILLPKLFEWFSPILPTLKWTTKSFIHIITPIVGFQLTTSIIKPFFLRERKKIGTGTEIPYDMFAILLLVMVWGAVGFLGFTPSVILSGSMRPDIEVGDMVIIVDTPRESLKVGDIIQYRNEAGTPIVHRIVEITGKGYDMVIVTKGDANNAPDDPILARGVEGKILHTIPKIGWISIYMKTIIKTTYDNIIKYKNQIIYFLPVILGVPSIIIIKKTNNKTMRRRLRKIRRMI